MVSRQLTVLSCRSWDIRRVRVLVIEDEAKLAGLLSRALAEQGIAADTTGSGEQGLAQIAATTYDVLVLDVMLPGIDGFETLRRIREAGNRVPVMMLTARDTITDRVLGLDDGADDYLVKPFALAELLARVRALGRRGPAQRPAVLVVGDLRLDPASRRASRAGMPIDLSAKEFAVLEALMRSPGEVLTRLELLERCWDQSYENRSNIIDVYVRYLREKIDRPFGRNSLETVRGSGYRLRDLSP
ncbi:MAG: two-component system, OmpR family, response regulator [Solirubrobacteraceae bacterium]|jgi:two-component system OmpR family response regulator|nr:two-component system, OmpR family, response regulator [Solirubrobacteraceae bacterium]